MNKLAERDPNGIDAHSPGAKLDAGKVRVGLMFRGFARALLKVAEVTTYGARKYTPGGWQHVENGIERYDDAKCRHLLKGYLQERDPETDIEEAAHEAWNALARLELLLREKESTAVATTSGVAQSLSQPPVTVEPCSKTYTEPQNAAVQLA
jgi:hypothetical protein